MPTRVSNYLLSPGTNRGRHPATMGSSWSCNMYREINQENEFLASVPGLKFYKRLATMSKCRGCYVSSVGLASQNQKENCFVVFGPDVFRIDWAGNAEQVGRIAGGTRRVSFAETGGLRPFLLIADGVNLWAYNLLEGGNLQQVTLPQRVTGDGGMIAPTHVCCIAGSCVINDRNTGFAYYTVPYPLNSETRQVFDIVNGEVQYEEGNSLKVKQKEVDALEYMFLDSYGVVQYINAESSADNLVALAAVGGSLYLFGSKTIEVWQRGSGEFQTWQRQSYTVNASNGLQAPSSVAICGSVLYYLGSGESYAKGVLTMGGNAGSAKKISEDWLDEKLLAETGDSAFGFAYAEGNHNWYVLHLTNLRECWVYDTLTNEWHERRSRVLETGNETRWRVSAMAWFKGKFWAFSDDGCVYGFSQDYWWEDYGSGSQRLPMIRHRQGAVIVDEERPFIFNELSVEANVGTVPDYDEEPTLELEVSADGGNTFGHVRSASLGKTGHYSHRVRYFVLGYNRLCVLRLTCSAPCSLELTACSQRVTPTTALV